jgi:superfamily II DNA/RNA helicase
LTDTRRGRGRGARRPASKDAPKGPPVQPLEPTAEPPDIESFEEFDLGASVQGAIAAMGITKPTPIQALAIGPVLKGRHVIAKAETGTGKTLAFGAPMMAKIDPARRTVLGLVLSPTRELAEQVHDVLAELGKPNDTKVALVVGGEPLQPQVKALQEGAQVVVGTPGRVLDLMGQGFLSFPWTEFVVLDEADKMLEIGFLEDIEKILAQVNEYRQTLLFSATFPPPLLKLARGQTEDPVEIATASGHATVETIRQCAIEVDDEGRARLLQEIVRRSDETAVFLVFCDRRTDVDRLMRRMERERYPVRALHGGYDQAARFKVMGAFRAHEVKVLIATDVASRGLDVKHVTHVVNFAAPRDTADYTHRIGRTGRAGREGTAVTFITPSTRRYWRDLVGSTKFEVEMLKGPRDLSQAPRKAAEDGDKPERRPRRERGRERDAERESADRPDRKERGEGEGARADRGEDRPRRSRGRSDEGTEETQEGRERGQRSREGRPRRGRRDEDGSRRRREDAPVEEAPAEEAPKRDAERPRRSDAPQRREREEVEAKAPAAGGGGFGAGLAEEAPEASSERRPRRRRGGRGSEGRRGREDGSDSGSDSGEGRRPKSQRRDGSERQARREAGGTPGTGFGAGVD